MCSHVGSQSFTIVFMVLYSLSNLTTCVLTRANTAVHIGSGSRMVLEKSLSVEAPLMLLQWCLKCGRVPNRGELRLDADARALENELEEVPV